MPVVLLARVQSPGGPRVAVLDREAGVLRPPGEHRIPGIEDAALESPLPLAAARLLAPVAPRTIVGIGRNYAAHAKELGNAVPTRPLMFLKPASSIVGPGEPILLPRDSAQVEHEAELGIVIGKRARHVRVEDAGAYAFGFTAVNDVTARDLQKKDVQFTRAKGFDSFCPVGPWIAVGLDPRALAVRCRVNGEVRQDGRTDDMVFDTNTLIAAVSRVMTLEPGDLIATGTPEGVSVLRDGDVVEVEIEGIGTLRNPVAFDADSLAARLPLGDL